MRGQPKEGRGQGTRPLAAQKGGFELQTKAESIGFFPWTLSWPWSCFVLGQWVTPPL